MKYRVIVEEVLRRTVEVEAESDTEALEQVQDAYRASEIVLEYSDFSDTIIRLETKEEES